MEGLLSSFFINLFAEFGDKTQLSVIALGSKYQGTWSVFIGAMFGVALATVLAVGAGAIFAQVLPFGIIHIISGLLFIAFGIYTIFEKEEEKGAKVKGGGSALFSSFFLLFAMELGDKTNLANVGLAAKFNPIEVLAGSLLSMTMLTGLGIMFGSEVAKRFDRRTVKAASAAIFIIVGIVALLSL